MPENGAPSFCARRFLWWAVPWTVAAGILWNYTHAHNTMFTVAVTKFLHRCMGYPAPYLFCDETAARLFWHATMFPPIIGLGFASYWLRWPDRILRVSAGYIGHCCLTAVAITISESPYLQQTAFRNTVTSPLVNADYLMFGIVIWLLTCGPWYSRRNNENDAGIPNKRVWGRAFSFVRGGWVIRLGLLVVGVSAVIPLFAITGSPAGREARGRVADALAAVPYSPHPSNENLDVSAAESAARDRLAVRALLEIEKVIKADEAEGQPSAALYYLTGHLLLSLRPDDPEQAKQFRLQAALALREANRTKRW